MTPTQTIHYYFQEIPQTYHTQMLHGTNGINIYLLIYHKKKIQPFIHLGKYTVRPMEHMGSHLMIPVSEPPVFWGFSRILSHGRNTGIPWGSPRESFIYRGYNL